MAVAQESEFLAVNQKIRVRVPAATPLHNFKQCARCQRSRGGGLQLRSYPVRVRARAPFSLEAKADKQAAADWKSDGPAVMQVVEHAHWLPRLFSLMEAEPDKRAGTVSNTDRAPCAQGEHALRLPPFFQSLKLP